jgi:hypothetical protein
MTGPAHPAATTTVVMATRCGQADAVAGERQFGGRVRGGAAGERGAGRSQRSRSCGIGTDRGLWVPPALVSFRAAEGTAGRVQPIE